MNNGECFCVNSDNLKPSVAMPDPCENWESTPGLKVMVCESRARMKLPNFYAYCLKVYLPNQNWLFQMFVIGFVSATIFNVQISPTFCEQYIRVHFGKIRVTIGHFPLCLQAAVKIGLKFYYLT